jgi:hypothetical protein
MSFCDTKASLKKTRGPDHPDVAIPLINLAKTPLPIGRRCAPTAPATDGLRAGRSKITDVVRAGKDDAEITAIA